MKTFYGDSIRCVNKKYDNSSFIDGIYSASMNKESINTITITCDIQPVDTSAIDTDAGKMIDAEYKIYCDINKDINTNTDIYFGDVKYNIIKIIKWSDYMILFVKAVI